jgi:hypothetical protein
LSSRKALFDGMQKEESGNCRAIFGTVIVEEEPLRNEGRSFFIAK